VLNVLFLVAGVALLTAGGEALIRGALSAARRMGISPLLSGLLIVGFGTSMPEMTVSVLAALDDRPDIAVGNVVGSNIGNLLLILGTCAVITPIAVHFMVLRRDAVAVIGASVLCIVLALDGVLSRVDALILLLMLTAFLVWAYRGERTGEAPSAELREAESETLAAVPPSAGLAAASVAAGLVLLIAGSQVLLKGAVGIAQSLGVSEVVIGLTLVAVGTSLPELSVSVIAAVRRQADVAVGNVLGSNLFNLLGILGVSAMLQPLEVNARVLQVDGWVMLATAVALFAFLYTGSRLSRTEGGVLLASYVVYLALTFSAHGGA
jgi:cation:H+ antiporter